ncbi:MAG: PKD domain-containing protein [Flavisolibacter sp.]
MARFKSNKAFFFFFILFWGKYGLAQTEEVIHTVGLEKVKQGWYRVRYQLSNNKDYNFHEVMLKIYRKRNGVPQEVFSKDMTPASREIKPDQTYSYDWKADPGTLLNGDALQAKIVLSYQKPAVAKAVELPANLPPKADGGGNLVVQLPLNLVVILDAMRSYDQDGRIVSVNWHQVSGPNTLTIASPASYKSYVVGDFKPGVYTFELSVTDDKGATSTDRVLLTVRQAAVAPARPQTSSVNGNGTAIVAKDSLQKPRASLQVAPPRLKGGPSNALVDLLLPGLGHYFVSGDYEGNERKPAVLLISALYAGSAGGAIYYKLRSNSQYNKYVDLSKFREYQKDANGNIIGMRGANQAEATQYLNDARNSQNNFLILASISGGIMVTDLIYTLIRGSKNKKLWKREYLTQSPLFFSSNGSNFLAGIRVKL